MPLPPGSRLGPYEVVAPVGDTGDERYTATDTRAHRTVGIKVLSPAQPLSGQARARLERDARTISSLKHPHISALVEVGHAEPATDFVVSEHADGETLAERLKRGPLALPEALQVAIAVADSLDKAHRRGVVHGGLCPTTVLLGDDGPKLLDFGIAAAADASRAESGAAAPPSMVATGTLTLSSLPPLSAPYIAPERWAGAPADARSDVFACGALLHEMVTGRPAFQEKTQALLVAAIQSVDADPVSAIAPGAPAALDHVVKRCLHRDPRQRLQTAWDLLAELRWIAEGSHTGVQAPVSTRSAARERAVWVAAAVAGAVAFGLAPSALSRFDAVPEPLPLRYNVVGLPGASGVSFTVSPDGRWVAGTEGAGSELFGVSRDSVTPQRLASGGEIMYQPFWSPDGRSVAFFGSSRVLKRVDLAGGPAQTIAEYTAPAANGTWNQDGVILFSSAGAIYRVLAAGGEVTPVTNIDDKGQKTSGEEHISPWFLPDGRHFLYTALSSDSAVYVAELGTKERTQLFKADSKAMYAAPGYIVFNRGTVLFAQPFDATTLKLTGEAVRIADGVAPLLTTPLTNPGRSGNFWVSQTGTVGFKTARGGTANNEAVAADAGRTLVWVNRNGQETSEVGTGGLAGVDLAPDGRALAVHVHDGTGGDVWTFDPEQRRMQRFTFDAAQENSSPVWSPDGSQIAYASTRNGQWGLYAKPADGSGTETVLVPPGVRKTPMSWSPDGKWLVFVQDGRGTDIWAVSLEGEKKPTALIEADGGQTNPQVSPDGKWLAYQSNETGQPEVYVKQFPEGPARRQVSTDGGGGPRWRGDGKELYFVGQNGIMAVDIDTTGSTPRPGVPRLVFVFNGNINLPGHYGVYARFAVSRDGQRFLLARTGGGRGGSGSDSGVDGVLMRTLDGGGGAATGGAIGEVIVLRNWPQLLKARAGSDPPR